MQPMNESARKSRIETQSKPAGAAPARHIPPISVAIQPLYRPFPKSSTKTAIPPFLPITRIAFVVPMFPEPDSRISVWKKTLPMTTPQGMEPSRKAIANVAIMPNSIDVYPFGGGYASPIRSSS